MLDILTILKFIHTAVAGKGDRFSVLDDDHIVDNKTGIELHLYDDWFKMTREGDNVITLNDMTKEEQQVIWQLKQLITDPETAKNKQENHKQLLLDRRKALSAFYEDPHPLDEYVPPVTEENAVEYMG